VCGQMGTGQMGTAGTFHVSPAQQIQANHAFDARGEKELSRIAARGHMARKIDDRDRRGTSHGSQTIRKRTVCPQFSVPDFPKARSRFINCLVARSTDFRGLNP